MTKDEFYAQAMIAALQGAITLDPPLVPRILAVAARQAAEALTAEWEKSRPKEEGVRWSHGVAVTTKPIVSRAQLEAWWNRRLGDEWFGLNLNHENNKPIVTEVFNSLCELLGLPEDA